MGSHSKPQRIAIIGGGWAGMAAAVYGQQAGHAITVFEASRHWGGRARGMTWQDSQGRPWQLDNGQHILIGAYSHCLDLMRTVGIHPEQALLRLPLDLRNRQGQGLHLPDLPPPWNALLGIARSQGWRWADKLALLRWALHWRLRKFQCADHASVADLCRRLPNAILHGVMEPLCISALNMPLEQASGRVFLRILQDSLFAGRGGADLLIPRVDMGRLFPASAAQWLSERGAQLRLGQRVRQLQAPAPTDGRSGWLVDSEHFDSVVLATPSAEAARLVHPLAVADAWAATAGALPHSAIATVYAYAPQLASGQAQLPAPMLALQSAPQAPAQFAFDQGQLSGQAGLLALVISTSAGDAVTLEAQATAQAEAQLGVGTLEALKTIIDKRATFACMPKVNRPSALIAPDLWACGDYVEGPYPATLEGAVRSAIKCLQGR